MTTADNPQATRLELAILQMRGSVDVRLTEIAGQLALLSQRAEQAERRADEREQHAKNARDAHAALIQRLDERVDAIEASAFTRADIDARSRRTITTLGVIAAATGALTSTATAIIIAILN